MSKSLPSEDTVIAWARLIRARDLLVSAAERDAKAEGLPPLEWYDVLLELSRLPEGEGLRPFELEGRLLLAQYNLSRLLDRLAKAGLIEKRPCTSDGRGLVLVITEAGRELRRRSWPAYAAAIERHFGSKLRPGDAEVLGEILTRLVDPKLGGVGGPAEGPSTSGKAAADTAAGGSARPGSARAATKPSG
jgi:DNA-binding MarR family transcriptional regulator